MAVDPVALLAGPRGRRLCLELARRRNDPGHEADPLSEAIFWAAWDLDPGRGTSRVLWPGVDQGSVRRYSPDDVARLLADVPLVDPDERTVLLAVVAAVDSARYWQEPDGEDVLVAAPELEASLARVAAQVADSPHSAWWATPIDGAAQWEVDFAEPRARDAITATAAQTLERWRAAQTDEEAAAERDRPTDPRAAWSGSWWSKPPSRLTRTTRGLDGMGPAGLWLVEDRFRWDAATVRRVRVPSAARAYEIDSSEAWAELCRRYPLDVTASRRHDWYRATARVGRWVIPDWAQVAEEFDAVHLTVAGYLAVAGRAIPVENEQMTVLAGWDLDETYWLTDVAHDETTLQEWQYGDDEIWRMT